MFSKILKSFVTLILNDIFDFLKLSINIYLNSYNMFDFNNKDENIFNYKSIIQDFILSEQYIIDYYDLYVEFKNNRIML